MCTLTIFMQRSLNVKDTVITNQQFKYHKNFYNSITVTFYSSANSLNVFISFFSLSLSARAWLRVCVRLVCFLFEFGSFFCDFQRLWRAWIMRCNASTLQVKIYGHHLGKRWSKMIYHILCMHTEWKCKYFSTGFRVNVVL